MKDIPLLEWWKVTIAAINAMVTLAASLCSVNEVSRWVFTVMAVAGWFMLGCMVAWNLLVCSAAQEDGEEDDVGSDQRFAC